MTDLERYESFYKGWYKAAVYIAERMIQHEGEAEDIAQECFFKLYKRGDFSDKIKMKNFMQVALRNACRDYLKHKRRVNNRQEDIISYLQKVDSHEEDFCSVYIQAELLLAKALPNLPARAKTIIVYYFEGLKTADIAHKLNLEPRTVLNQKTRAISLLRAAVAK